MRNGVGDNLSDIESIGKYSIGRTFIKYELKWKCYSYGI